MSAELALRLVTYLLVGDGLAALFVADLIGLPGAGLVALAIGASWWHERARRRGAVRPALGWTLVGTAAVAIGADLFYLASTALDGMVHALLFLILVRLFMCRRLRDLRDAGYLSFFLLIAASSATFSIGFLFVFVAFLLLGTWMLMLHHIVAESERSGQSPSSLGGPRLLLPGSPLMRISLLAAAATFLISGVLFFVIPRVGQAVLPLRTHFGRMVTGFSDRVDLGAFGEIETDRTVVMRAYFPEDTIDPSLLPNLRWRGIVFDRFDGRSWSVGRPARVTVRRGPGGQFSLGFPRGRGAVVRQEIYLDPLGTDIVFAVPRALRIDARAATLSVDDMESLSMPTPSARLHYIVDSEIEMPHAPGTGVHRAGLTLPGPERDRYLQLPPLSPAIAKLAKGVSEGSRDPYEAALKLNHFLSTQFRYTLSKRETRLEPLEEFLFSRRAGNCEYFSAALAVMLRSLGIPARVVGGFQRGEWNPYGRYFMVSLSDAHAWVEAHFDGLGWVTLDPSPRVEAAVHTGPWALSLYLDAARMRWYRYVINWSLQDQRLFASSVQRQAGDFRLALKWPVTRSARLWLIVSGLLLVAGALLWGIWRFVGPARRGRPLARAPRFYELALRRLARRGLKPEPAETARQFCHRAGTAAPGCAEPLTILTATYERARFGSAALTEDEAHEVERCLAALARR